MRFAAPGRPLPFPVGIVRPPVDRSIAPKTRLKAATSAFLRGGPAVIARDRADNSLVRKRSNRPNIAMHKGTDACRRPKRVSYTRRTGAHEGREACERALNFRQPSAEISGIGLSCCRPAAVERPPSNRISTDCVEPG
jgi:hypothetical protein